VSVGRRLGLVAVGGLAVAGAGLTAAAAMGFGFADDDAPAEPAPPSTAEVTRQDLVATVDEPGELGHATDSTLLGEGGVVTWMPAEGAVVERGGQLLRVDEQAVVLLYGALPAYRTLSSGAEGADVRQFEENLAALGYGGFEVDEHFGWATAEAVMDWQSDLGLERTGVVDPARIHYEAGPVEVATRPVDVGERATGELLTVASRDRVVTVDLDESEAHFATVGASVEVTLPDGSTFAATITAVSTVIVPGDDTPSGDSDDRTVLRVTATPDDPASVEAAAPSTATVGFTADRRDGVLTVPVTALLALAEGGYGVEVVAEGARDARAETRLIAVDTGLFADGRVEIAGDGVDEGDSVVVPG
jgi:peptidoglycan hydrolase-like protein with peptidoglycan-binding domain